MSFRFGSVPFGSDRVGSGRVGSGRVGQLGLFVFFRFVWVIVASSPRPPLWKHARVLRNSVDVSMWVLFRYVWFFIFILFRVAPPPPSPPLSRWNYARVPRQRITRTPHQRPACLAPAASNRKCHWLIDLLLLLMMMLRYFG